jgi:hypothetical protein
VSHRGANRRIQRDVARLDPRHPFGWDTVLRMGTKRVRQPGHGRARASLIEAVTLSNFPVNRARTCPRVPARPSLVFPSYEGVPGSSPGVGLENSCKTPTCVASNGDSLALSGT